METALAKQSEAGAELESLGDQEQADLVACEATIDRGLASFVEVGRALLTIRDGRLYRNSHETFADYCRDRWQMGRAHANRYIDGSTVVGVLSPIGAIPANEAQARPLTRIRAAEGALDRQAITNTWLKVLDWAPTLPNGRRYVTASAIESEVVRRVRARRSAAGRSQAVAGDQVSTAPVIRRAPRATRRWQVPSPKIALELPTGNPQATVATLAHLFDRPYMEAVAAGLQRFLTDGHLEVAAELARDAAAGEAVVVKDDGGEA